MMGSGQRLNGAGGAMRAAKRPRVVMAIAGVLLLAALIAYGCVQKSSSATKGASGPQVVRVEASMAKRADVPVVIEGLGTVQALYTATISPRVDGELVKVHFVEGQMVKRGDLLAEIDPRPYQAALDQAIGVKGKDVAQLVNAKRDLERYISLAPEEFTSKQTLDTQRALVDQLEAQIKTDQAGIDSAQTQLDYATMRSPIDGRTGVRLTDPGNVVHAASTTGIVVITQVQPITVLFTLPADALQEVLRAMAAGPVTATAVSRNGKTELGAGVIGLIDNLIDQTTGTMRLKATFSNRDNKLWPGDFVNVKVQVQLRRNVLTIPTTGVQRGPDGVFAYVVKADGTVEMRRIEIGEESGSITIVEKGLQDGETVTTTNQYRLQAGAKVQVMTPAAAAAEAKSNEKGAEKADAKREAQIDKAAPKAATGTTGSKAQ